MKMNIIYSTAPKKQFKEISNYTCFLHQNTLYFKTKEYNVSDIGLTNAICLDDEVNCMTFSPFELFPDFTLVTPVSINIKVN